MMDEYLCIRATDKNATTFSFPITLESLEDFNTMRLHEKLDFEKELSEVIEPGSDGFFEFVRVNFEANNLVDGIYFLKSEYIEIYQRMSEYEKSIFKAYLKNEKFDFKELSEDYANFNNSEELQAKVLAHDEKSKQFFELINFDDGLKARIFEEITIEVDRRKTKEKLHFLSTKDAKNYDLIEREQKNLVFHLKINVPIILPKAIDFSAKNPELETEEVLNARYERIGTAIGIGNSKLLFEYIEEKTIDLKKIHTHIMEYDLYTNDGQIIDYLKKNNIKLDENCTEQEREELFKQIFNLYFYKIQVLKNSQNSYFDFIERKAEYFESLGLDLTQEKGLISGNKANIFCELAVKKTFSINDYKIKHSDSDDSRKLVLEEQQPNYDLSLAYLKLAKKYIYRKDKSGKEFNDFIVKAPNLYIKHYLKSFSDYENLITLYPKEVAALAHKIDAAYDYIREKNLDCPEEICNIEKSISDNFNQEAIEEAKKELINSFNEVKAKLNADQPMSQKESDDMDKEKDDKLEAIALLFNNIHNELKNCLRLKATQAKLEQWLLENNLNKTDTKTQLNLKI